MEAPLERLNMLYEGKTDFGEIKYDTQIIADIVKKIVSQMDGKVHLSTAKGRQLKLSENPGAENNYVEAEIDGDEIDIEVYIIIKFGTSITKSAEEITAKLRDIVPKVTGLSPNLVKIVIKGVVSKNFSKRHIEVESYANDSSE